MSDHILSNIDADKLLSIVDGEGESDHIRDDMAGPIPDFNDFLISCFVHFFDLDEYFLVHIESFF